MSMGSILYLDHSGRPAPLSLTYRATTSRILSSPPSILTETDSAYCPQCLNFHDAATASSKHFKGRCQGAFCCQCPVCTATLSIVVEEDEEVMAFYRCGYCRWSSRECNLVHRVDHSGRDKDAIARGLSNTLQCRTAYAKGNEVFQSLKENWKNKIQEEERNKKYKGATARPTKANVMNTTENRWSMESLEASIAKKKIYGHVPNPSPPPPLAEERSMSPLDQMTSQMALHPGMVSKLELLPIRIPFRVRKGRRCRAELAAGRPGILVKPKVNPLEGDSSALRIQGKWWKKDCSAIHSVPKVQILHSGCNNTDDHLTHALLLKVHNPTHDFIRCRFSITPQTNESPLKWNDLLLDHLERRYVNARHVPTPSASYSVTVELQAMEDSFMDRTCQDPEKVQNWNMDSLWKNSKANTVRVIANRGDTAWVQLILTDDAENVDGYVATYLTLEVEVGNGSWGSSQIQPKDGMKEGEMDLVPFLLLAVWKV